MRYLVAPVLLGLAACSGGSNEPQASNTPDPELMTPAATATPTASASETSPSDDATATESPSTAAAIPVALQGRWGLVRNDCTMNVGAEKGLVTIGVTEMKFYESIAKLKSAKVTPTTLDGQFAYSGEGMDWNRRVTMKTTDGSKTLVFQEFGDDAPQGARTYTKC